MECIRTFVFNSLNEGKIISLKHDLYRNHMPEKKTKTKKKTITASKLCHYLHLLKGIHKCVLKDKGWPGSNPKEGGLLEVKTI